MLNLVPVVCIVAVVKSEKFILKFYRIVAVTYGYEPINRLS